jgi:hypothetical protein
VSLTMYFIKGETKGRTKTKAKTKNKKGSKRCLDYLAEEAIATPYELKGIKPSSLMSFQQLSLLQQQLFSQQF